MARPVVTDLLQTSNFYLFDIGPIDAFSLPIFIPLFGFSSITSPELTLSTQAINQANALYPHEVITGASVGPITLSRGICGIDSDFWRWINATSRGYTGGGVIDKIGGSGGINNNPYPLGEIGGVTYRRNLLLVHFFRNFYEGWLGITGAAATTTGISAAAGYVASDYSGLDLMSAGITFGQLGLAQALGATLGDIPESQKGRIFLKVPARAFLLRNCIPTRYKAGTDYDASTSQVSIAELEVNVESFEEIALAAT